MLPDEDIIKLIPKTKIFVNYFIFVLLFILVIQFAGVLIQNLI
jgi:hypothetical protein